MTRLERRKKEKYSKKKYKSICRILFLFLMMTITSSCIFLIDYRINKVLDDDSEDSITKYINDIF